METTDPETMARDAHQTFVGRHVLLLTDYDGTLAEFMPRPEIAWIDRVAQAGLEAVVRLSDMTAGVVSGRLLEDVRTRVNERVSFFAGLHGFEIEGPDASFRHPALDIAPPAVQRVLQRAEPALAWCRGLNLEDKVYALVCDVRLADPADGMRARAEFAVLAEDEIRAGRLRLKDSGHASELLPPGDWDKGRAVQWIRECVMAAGQDDPAVVYLGDDRTDEDAFAALADGDFAIRVGPLLRARPGQHWLEGPIAVGHFLTRLAALRARHS